MNEHLVDQPSENGINEIDMVTSASLTWKLGDAPYCELLEPFSTKGLSSWTTFWTGFSSAHTAASKYPSSKSLSRIWSSAGSNAQLKSWNSWQQRCSLAYHKNERDINPSATLTSLGVALFSGLQSGLIPIPCSPKPLAEKAQTRTCMVACEQSYHPER